MAIALLGPTIDKIKGSIKGTTFQPLGVFQIVKGKARSNRPNSSQQLPNLATLAQYAPLWRTLTPAQRTAWATYASSCAFVNSLGITYQCTGSAHYFRAALYYNSREVLTPFDSPTDTGLPSLPLITFDYAAPDLRITAIAPAPPAGAQIRGTVWGSTPASRLNPVGRSIADFVWDADALPFVIAAGVDPSLALGLLRNAHITYRYSDDFQRITTRVRKRFSYTTA